MCKPVKTIARIAKIVQAENGMENRTAEGYRIGSRPILALAGMTVAIYDMRQIISYCAHQLHRREQSRTQPDLTWDW